MSKNQKYLIALAGLFHDIGKFYQRATNEKISESERKPFEYAHAFLTFKVLFNELLEGLSSVFEEDEISIISEGAFHHKPHNNLQYLLQKADWVSSSEREKAEAEYVLTMEELKDKIKSFSEKYPRLRSIFEGLNLTEKEKKRGFVHKISPLNLSEDIFPKDLEEIYVEIIAGRKKS
ncbi:HD domain-containing protein [Persephonella sp.]